MSKVNNSQAAKEQVEETTDSDDDEKEEPKLKYGMLGTSVEQILGKDTASCLSVFKRFLVLGTRLGKIYVLDFNGNQIRFEVQNSGAHIHAFNGNLTLCLIFSRDISSPACFFFVLFLAPFSIFLQTIRFAQKCS
jgi:hypothetical protein